MGLMDRYFAVRDRWLSSPQFQRWAAAFPLTRPTARKRARALFDVCAGFVYSQILYACVRLKVFDLLALGPQTATNIANILKLPRDSTDRLLEAAVSLRLVEKRMAGRFGLGPLGTAMVGNPGVAAMVEHHTMFYADLRDPVGLLRGERSDTELARYWAYSRSQAPSSLPRSKTQSYTALMGNSSSLVAAEILDNYPLHRHRRLMDVGGGDGSFLIAAAERCEKLEVVLFDLPPVAEQAARRFADLGLQDRASSVGGDFFSDALPHGADIISLVRVIHDHDDAAAQALLRAIFEALPVNGVLLIAEPMSGTPGAEAAGDAYFGFYLLAMGSGKPRAPKRLRQMLAAAGFTDTHLVHTHQPLQARLIVARKTGISNVYKH
jgi:demethylspheroidene O-methyltransferase